MTTTWGGAEYDAGDAVYALGYAAVIVDGTPRFVSGGRGRDDLVVTVRYLDERTTLNGHTGIVRLADIRRRNPE